MEEIKQTITTRLAGLSSLKFRRPTARELHQQRGHLLNRVQRRANKLYQQRVGVQKKRLSASLDKIRTYELALQAEEDRRAIILADWEQSQVPIEQVPIDKTLFTTESVFVPQPVLPQPVFSLLSTAVPKPEIVIRQTPIKSRTRLERVRKYRGGR